MPTLQEFIDETGTNVQTHQSGAKYVVAMHNVNYTDLFWLSDYVVSSFTAGTYWLVLKDLYVTK